MLSCQMHLYHLSFVKMKLHNSLIVFRPKEKEAKSVVLININLLLIVSVRMGIVRNKLLIIITVNLLNEIINELYHVLVKSLIVAMLASTSYIVFHHLHHIYISTWRISLKFNLCTFQETNIIVTNSINSADSINHTITSTTRLFDWTFSF